MSTVFADTFYYLALINPRDWAHRAAANFTRRFDGAMVTHAWILSELADALASGPARSAFHAVYDSVRTDNRITVVPASPELFDAGMRLYLARPDKQWALTDCISFEVMRLHRIADALTGDRHFEQAGYVALLK